MYYSSHVLVEHLGYTKRAKLEERGGVTRIQLCGGSDSLLVGKQHLRLVGKYDYLTRYICFSGRLHKRKYGLNHYLPVSVYSVTSGEIVIC